MDIPLYVADYVNYGKKSEKKIKKKEENLSYNWTHSQLQSDPMQHWKKNTQNSTYIRHQSPYRIVQKPFYVKPLEHDKSNWM